MLNISDYYETIERQLKFYWSNFCPHNFIYLKEISQTISYESPVEAEFQWVNMLLCTVIRQKYEVEYDWPI